MRSTQSLRLDMLSRLFAGCRLRDRARAEAVALAAAMIFSTSDFVGIARAAAVLATPKSLSTIITGAKSGDVITLGAGDYGQLSIENREWPSAVVLDAQAAQFTGLVLKQVKGLTILGGAISAPGGKSYGINLSDSSGVSLIKLRITGAHRGVVISGSRDIRVEKLLLTGIISDGIDIATSHRITINENRCENFSPNLATYDSSGARISDGDHPDCIQAWSRPPDPVSDLTITNNVVIGDMQGIGLFNHIRNGIDDGGFDRVIIKGNVVHVRAPQGIALYSGRNSVVRDNDVRSLPGSTFKKNGARVKTNINVIGGSDNEVCGNIVPDIGHALAATPCSM